MNDFVYTSPNAPPWVPKYLSVQNRRGSAIMNLALQVGSERRGDIANPDEIDRVKQWMEAWYPGIHIDMASLFPTLESRRFWAGVFLDVGAKIFRRELGDQNVNFWQARGIYHVMTLAEMLLQMIQDMAPNSASTTVHSLDWTEERDWKPSPPKPV
jgi:hypothetical protein